MSDRLAELRRQRALVQEQLAWLDKEIVAEVKRDGGLAQAPSSPAPSPSLSAPVRAPGLAANPLLTPATAPAGPTARVPASPAEAMLDEYRVAPETLQSDVKKGCFLYLSAAFGLLAVIIGIFWAAFHYLRHSR